tara:strand:+ start:2689 stop:3429 length:741 start_codon:yes stop_codon:yes gene_type:complete
MENLYSIKKIKNSQDRKKVKSFLFLYFLIPLAWPFTWILIKLNISANQVTSSRIILIFIAYIIIILDHSITGYILIYFTLLMDNIDGQISRVTNSGSYYGKYMDGWTDCLFEITFPITLGYYIYTKTGDYQIFSIGLFAGLFYGLFYLTLLRYAIFKKNEKKHEFNGYKKKILYYLENHISENLFDIKYTLFPILAFFSMEELYLKALMIFNLTLFILFSIKKFYVGFYLLNVHKTSSTQNRNYKA